MQHTTRATKQFKILESQMLLLYKIKLDLKLCFNLANTHNSCHTQQRRHTQAPFLQFYFITRSLFSFSCCCCASVLTFYFVLRHREFYCAVYVNCYYTFMLAEIGYKCQKELPDCTKGQVPKQKQRNESGRRKIV